MEPLFSIITVTWNAAEVIAPTLSSVAEQSFIDYEYLVIDGASTDDTLELVRQANILNTRIFSEPDRGLYDAMNKAIDRAMGRYLIFLNAGDSFASASTLAQIAPFASDSPGVIYGQTQLVDATRRVVGARHLTAPRVLTADSFKQGMLVCHQAFIARRDLVPKYDMAYRYSADYDWCIKVLMKSEHNAYVGKEPIISFLTDGLTDRHHHDSLKERFAIMCKYYGTLPTVWRHVSFIPRYVANKLRRRIKKY
ncbi:MAG: glycosyltransferase [Bacteroidales bacterium]|nr:glycosyltransferase [Candidatus Sodaliphilus fimicaballi]